MRFGDEMLTGKALLALEEAVQECRYRQPKRSFALRFALAFLWSRGRCGREPFDRLWRALAEPPSPWSFSAADSALQNVYRALGLERNEEAGFALWRRRHREEGPRSENPAEP